MIYGSVCSGIEAATAAWHPLGWRPAFFSEIEPFPRAVLAHHYPNVPLHGDFTTIQKGDYEPIDLLVGGTPCQSFSVAGLRGGLADDRGNLALEFLRLAQRLRPQWLVWENVPGVLSSNGGRDFGSILGGMVELGYGIAYRVLDAQFFGVPQRRRRVFVVGYLGDWRRAAAVLFERHSLSGNPAPSREARKDAAAAAARSVALRGRDGGATAELGDDVGNSLRTGGGGGDKAHILAPTLSARTRGGGGLGAGSKRSGGRVGRREDAAWAFGGNNTAGPIDVATAVNACASASGRMDFGSETFVVPFDTTQITSAANYSNPKPGDPCHPLARGMHPPAIAFSAKDHGGDALEDCSPTFRAGWHSGSHANAGCMPAIAISGRTRGDDGRGYDRPEHISDIAGALDTVKPDRVLAPGSVVRRLIPRECERLQGFPDDYTLIQNRGKPAADGPRYKALGNSMAVPCMRWIGERIAAVDAIVSKDNAA